MNQEIFPPLWSHRFSVMFRCRSNLDDAATYKAATENTAVSDKNTKPKHIAVNTVTHGKRTSLIIQTVTQLMQPRDDSKNL